MSIKWYRLDGMFGYHEVSAGWRTRLGTCATWWTKLELTLPLNMYRSL